MSEKLLESELEPELPELEEESESELELDLADLRERCLAMFTTRERKNDLRMLGSNGHTLDTNAPPRFFTFSLH
jgi:hypothetical protein